MTLPHYMPNTVRHPEIVSYLIVRFGSMDAALMAWLDPEDEFTPESSEIQFVLGEYHTNQLLERSSKVL